MGGVDVPADLLGRRVALRHRLADGLLTDAVGELSDAGADAVVVHTRRGPVRVARSAVVAVRAIPPPVPRRASWTAVARLENLCADAWPAPADRPLGAWRLRAAGGFTGRANAALALGDPGLPVPAALDAVRAFAAEHGVAPRVHAPIGSPWDRAVAAAGWVLDVGHEAGAEVAVLVVDVDRLAQPAARRSHTAGEGPDPDGQRVLLSERPTEAWWALSLGRAPTPDERFVLDPLGNEPAPSDQQLGSGPTTGRAPRTAFGLVPGVGVVRAVVVDDHLHLSRLAVGPAARRAGMGTQLTAAAAGWGRANGARWAVLQVALHNAAARALYGRLGAVEHHRYRYLVPPAGA
jgi:ribosomal protein S18 acetylase RimI-like enzyme